MILCLHLHESYCATVVNALTLDSSEVVITPFYKSLRGVLNSLPVGDNIILLSDFNTWVGTDWETWSSLGRYGSEKTNSSGLLLLDLCTEFNLFISSTQFKHKGDYVTTWMHPCSHQWHLIDYVIIRNRDICRTCTMFVLCVSADIWTDHTLVSAKLNLVLKPVTKRGKNTRKFPEYLDIEK